EHRAQDKAQYQWSSFEVQSNEEIAGDPEHGSGVDIFDAIVDAERSHAAEKQDRRKQCCVGDPEDREPVANHRSVHNDEEAITHLHACTHALEETGVWAHKFGPRLNPLQEERYKNKRHHGVLGNAKAHQRNKAGSGGGSIGTGLACNAFKSPRADLLSVLA